MDSSFATRSPAAVPEFLAGGGEMGERIRQFDWTKTALGVPETWEQSLKTCVRIMLTSSQPIWIGWGKELIKLYNDPYRAIAGNKHPHALGLPASVVWKDIWHDIEPMLNQVMEKNEGTYVENQLLIMERFGYPEETYFTFSYSPVPGHDGKTAGMICYNTSDTERIINERSLQTLRALGALTKKQNLEDVYRATIAVLAKNDRDFPFAIISKIDELTSRGVPFAYAGIDPNHHQLPQAVDLVNPGESGRNFAMAVNESVLVYTENPGKWTGLPTGSWSIPPSGYVHVPLKAGNNKFPIAVLTLGLNPYRKFDETFRNFIQLITDQVSLEISNVLAYEEERKRAEALAEIDMAKTVFFSNISHEFRTPLTLMLGPLEELIRKSKDNFSARELRHLETSHRNAMRLLKMVNALLDFSRIEAGRQQPNFSLTDIAAFTRSLASNFSSVMEKGDLAFTINIESIDNPILLDKDMWEKIVFNLLSNAFKYTLKGSVTLDLATRGNTVIMKVHDTGIGIPAEELPRMFERFHRVNNAGGRTIEGTGIGLSLVKELVQLHNGSVTVESSPGQGSTFTVVIPMVHDHAATAIVETGMPGAGESAKTYLVDEAALLESSSLSIPADEIVEVDVDPTVIPGGVRPLVLIVDDNADMREHIRSLLSLHFNTVTAENGMAAMHRVSERIPDLIISDIMMPVLDGIGLLKEIKQNKSTAHIPVILLTARAGEESRIEGWETGADDYLVKPFSSRELISRIGAQIRTARVRKEAEESLFTVIQQAPVGMALLKGENFVIEIVNEKILSLWGKQRHDLLNRPLAEVMPTLAQEGIEHTLKEVFRSGQRYSANEVSIMVERNGRLEELYFNFTYEPLRNPRGDVDRILIAGIDITAQVLINKVTAANEAKVRNLFTQAPVSIVILEGEDMIVTLANERQLEIWGRTAEEVMYRPLFEAIPEGRDQSFHLILQDVYRTGKSYEGKEVSAMLLRNGKPYSGYYDIVYQPMKDESGNVSGLLCLTIEVTEKVIARKNVEEHKNELQNIFRQAPVTIVVYRGNDFRVEVANDAALRLWAKSENEVLHKPFFEISPELKETQEPLLRGIMETGESYYGKEFEAKFYRDGKLYKGYFNFVYQAARNEANEITGVIAIGTEVTDSVIARKKIEESELRFANMLMQSPFAFGILKGKEMIITLANDAIKELWGKGGDVEGKPISDVLPEIVNQGFTSLMEGVYTTGQPYYGHEMPVKLVRNGVQETIYFNFIYQPYRETDNSISGVVIIANEVTTQAIANRKIAAAEANVRNLFLQTPVGIGIFRGEENIIELVNDTMLAYWGCTRDEAIGKPLWDLLPSVKAQGLDKISSAVYQTGIPYSSPETMIFLPRDGKENTFYASFALQPRRDEHGDIIGLLGIANDITAQVVSRQEVEQSERELKELANAMPQLVWVADPDGKVVYYNDRIGEFEGSVRNEEGRWIWGGMVHPDDLEATQRSWSTACETGNIYQQQHRIKLKNGQYRWFLSRGYPQKNEQGDVVKWFGTATDIHDQITFAETLENKVRERTEELKNANTILESKNIELNRQNEELASFTYIASHDLQEPLRKIQIFTSRILEQESSSFSTSTRNYFNRISLASLRMQNLIESLLNYSRTGSSDRLFVKTDLNVLLDEVKSTLQDAVEEKNIVIESDKLPVMDVIPHQFTQLLLNLLSNSIKYRKPGTDLLVQIKAEKIKAGDHPELSESYNTDIWKISVADNGIGFEPEYERKVFELFQRLHGRDEYSGTGIGLAICKKIVQNHHGSISAKGRPGVGATFTIYLPENHIPA